MAVLSELLPTKKCYITYYIPLLTRISTMIVPKGDMSTSDSGSSDHTSQRPPSYRVEDFRSIDPVDKRPVFPAIPELELEHTAINTTYPNDNRTSYTTISNPPSVSNLASSSKAILTTSLNDIELPAAFSRIPPPHISYDSFKPLFLVANGKTLEKGFPRVQPPSVVHPHPFTYHDVTESDWLRLVYLCIYVLTLPYADIPTVFWMSYVQRRLSRRKI